MKKYLFSALLSVSVLYSAGALSAKNIQYVSDDLTIPMRSGTTNAHKILKFLNSGVAVEVIELTEDNKHALVTLVDDPSKTGWVENSLLMPQKSARNQLAVAKKKNQSLKDRLGVLGKELNDLKNQNTDLQSVQTRLENKIESLQATLARLRENSSDPIRIADENEKLQQQLSTAETEIESLTQENIILGDQNIKQWFMIGAAVSIGSLILGLLITRIRWKKSDRWA